MLFLGRPHQGSERIYGQSKGKDWLNGRERKAQQDGLSLETTIPPWLTTLISTLVGPLMVLLLILIFGPYILNKLVTFVKECINTVQLLILRQQYQALPQNKKEDSSI